MTPENTRRSALTFFEEQGNAAVPYTISLGVENEPHAIIIGATHGNEPAGVEAMLRYHAHLVENPEVLSGKVTFVLGNPAGYAQDIRYCDEDLNRAFYNRIFSSTVEGKRALELTQLLAQFTGTRTTVLDLHSVSRGNFKMTAYSADNDRNKQLALQVSPLSLHFSYHAEHLGGLLVDQASHFGFDALGIECGNHESADSVETALDHINRLLIHYKILNEKDILSCLPPQDEQLRRVYETITAIRPGLEFRFLDEKIVSESLLNRGEAFAWDRDHGEHIAPQDCYVMMPSKIIKSTDIDAGFLCVRCD